MVDLAIVGSGSGNSLLTPYWEGKQVAIAESGVFGGTCLNVGCIPTKMFVRPAQLARTRQEAARLNVELPAGRADFAAIRERIFSRIDPISAGGRDYREQAQNVRLLGHVQLLDGHTLRTEEGEEIHAQQIVLAAGSRPVLPQIEGIDLPGVHTSDTIMRIDQPRRLAVIGAGFIACEFASIFSGLGTEVIQLVRGTRLLKYLDEEICEAFNQQVSWPVQFDAQPQRITEAGGELSVHTSAGTFAVDAVLVATGRQPNSEFTAPAGLDLHEDGRVKVDEYQRVLRGGEPVAGLYALGDICSEQQLKHAANYQARVVAHNLEHPQDLRTASQRAVPAAVFTHPEIAHVGLTEAEAREQIGEHLTVKTQKYGDTAYGWAMEDAEGLFKVLADKRDGRILGAHVIGYEAANLIQPLVTAMNLGIDAHKMARGQYWIHPALMEVAENALLGLDVPDSGEL
ncbi:mycothione reductase [Glutamicibacter uratoxydans]|uniref:Mycothione reductase n=1 Tax=Glutamicibacter uratoxydans TaxID=43667 RepID=A0A4Y4DRK0_GLUUR|nr:mycothione reductase [Glutamicibacter uratoxydans]GED07263.1 mycothione reductase [Glutamicibacter uratoxydans]